ncbi:MAG: 4Fe-4S dicluster domain-containing protein [Verrucomicrobiota bacterium]|nr:4Fe-4S dicluster domain-containing protein [Verrucomicrobiota bacterium]
MKSVSAKALLDWVDDLIRKRRVMGAQARDDRFTWGPLARAADLRLDYDVTLLPPKVFLQPPREKLLEFSRAGGYTSCVEAEPFVLLGVHPYDLAAIRQMDEVFSQDHADARYLKRREAATIVAVDVQAVSANTFAGHMGASHVETGYDILLTRIGDGYVAELATKKGEAIAGALASAADADAAAQEARREVWAQNAQRLKKHELKAAPADWPGLLRKGYEHSVWEEKAKLCFSCGSCTLTCPTCYCFDAREDVGWSLARGTRVRIWDSCMLADFAKVAGGHNFRKNKADRYRHRYYRKGQYIPEKIGGQIACVGCGRCITACVARIANPVEVFNRLAEAR